MRLGISWRFALLSLRSLAAEAKPEGPGVVLMQKLKTLVKI
jgi:hypothetical protein